MIGLPGEREEDMKGIADIIAAVAALRKTGHGRWEVNVTISTFVPKAHTPFQWDPMDAAGSLDEKQRLLRRIKGKKNVKIRFHDFSASVLEAVFARGDASLGGILYDAWKRGCRFDGWSECFKPELWREAHAAHGVDMAALACKTYGKDDRFPWDLIDSGVKRDYLWREREKALEGEYTEDCTREGCVGCGVCGSVM
jgi:radical SAM superfamily enzyme YgiQ (UPF0313 family)